MSCRLISTFITSTQWIIRFLKIGGPVFYKFIEKTGNHILIDTKLQILAMIGSSQRLLRRSINLYTVSHAFGCWFHKEFLFSQINLTSSIGYISSCKKTTEPAEQFSLFRGSSRSLNKLQQKRTSSTIILSREIDWENCASNWRPNWKHERELSAYERGKFSCEVCSLYRSQRRPEGKKTHANKRH